MNIQFRTIKNLIPILGIIIFVYLVVNIGIEKILVTFSLLKPLHLTIAFFFIIPVLVITNYQWQLILRKQKIDVSPLDSLKILLVGCFYSYVTPGGLGSYARIFYLKGKSKEPIEKCISNILIFDVLTLLSTLFFATIGGFFLIGYLPNIFILIFAILITVIFLFAFFMKKERGKKVLKILLRIFISDKSKEKFNISVNSLYKDFPETADLIFPFLIALIGALIYYSELYIIATFILIDIPYVFFILITPIGSVIGSIPITILGLGTRDVVLIAAFSLFGVMPEKIVVFGLFWALIMLIAPGSLGAIISLREIW
jgi:hypothetical protein